MIYDRSLNKCVVLIGERCSFHLKDDITSTWYKVDAPCAGTAKRGRMFGNCFCPDGSYRDLNLTLCHSCKELNGICSREVECNEQKMLHCINGTCVCNPIISNINPSDRIIKEIRFLNLAVIF